MGVSSSSEVSPVGVRVPQPARTQGVAGQRDRPVGLEGTVARPSGDKEGRAQVDRVSNARDDET